LQIHIRPYSSGVRLNDVVIVSGVRTPIGSFGSVLSSLSAPQLAAVAIQVSHIM
jgi:acetyl-CoA C-acetyltransferase